MSNPGNLPEDGIGALTTLTVTLIFAGASFALIGGTHHRASGARRSVRLQFEQQQAEMRLAAAADGLTGPTIPNPRPDNAEHGHN